jgi:DUF4097 and DUF4098 domain-containing protein YvlB
VLTNRKDDGTLDVRVVWPENKRRGNEGASFEVEIPDANGVALDTSNGAITLAGMRGPAKLDTSNGAITVEGHDGSVVADSSNGKVVLNEVTGKVNADTSNGAIEVRLADSNPGPVRLDTSNGRCTLGVGSAFGGTIEADTSNGRVTVSGLDGLATAKTTKTSGKVTFSNPGEKSVIDTSNGSIEITRR